MNVIPFPPQPVIRSWRVAEIAERHGFLPDDPIVLVTLEAAIDMHGCENPDYAAHPERCWDVDPRTGKVDAALLLDGWLGVEGLDRRPRRTACRSAR